MNFPPNTPREVIYGQVIGKANNYMAVPAANGEKRIIKNAAIRDYERNFLRQVRIYRNRHIRDRFTLYVAVYFNNPLNDIDNAIKTILDCLQYCDAITNDNLCAEIHAAKHVDTKNPRIEFAILETQTTLF